PGRDENRKVWRTARVDRVNDFSGTLVDATGDVSPEGRAASSWLNDGRIGSDPYYLEAGTAKRRHHVLAPAESGDGIMDGLGIPVTGVPFVAFAPRSIVRHRTADWSAIRADNVEVVRHEAFDYEFMATSRHLLIVSERGERYDGESFVEGLPKSHV